MAQPSPYMCGLDQEFSSYLKIVSSIKYCNQFKQNSEKMDFPASPSLTEAFFLSVIKVSYDFCGKLRSIPRVSHSFSVFSETFLCVYKHRCTHTRAQPQQLFGLCEYMYMCGSMQAAAHGLEEGHLSGAASLLPCRLQGLNSGQPSLAARAFTQWAIAVTFNQVFFL